MSKLRLSFACWDYDRTRALADGTVRPDGIELTYLSLPVEETFFRMMRSREFDASECRSRRTPLRSTPRTRRSSPSRSSPRASSGTPASSSRRRAASAAEDLKGKRVGVPEYQMTAPVWIRGILSDDYGVKVTDYEHLSGGEEEPGRIDKLKIDLPSSIRIRAIGPTQTLSQMIAAGELDAMVTARAPSTFHKQPDAVKRLFPDYVPAERDYYRRTKIFPIMHTVVIRRDVYEKNPWVAQSLYKALAASKARAVEMYQQTAALPAMVPWLIAHLEETRREMGDDWWPYGLEPNRHVLDTFLRYHTSRDCRSNAASPRTSSRARPSSRSRSSHTRLVRQRTAVVARP